MLLRGGLEFEPSLWRMRGKLKGWGIVEWLALNGLSIGFHLCEGMMAITLKDKGVRQSHNEITTITYH